MFRRPSRKPITILGLLCLSILGCQTSEPDETSDLAKTRDASKTSSTTKTSGASSGGQNNSHQTNETFHLTVLHTNDHHGRFWHNKHGEYGLAARKTLVDRIRAEVAAEGGYTLLLSGGDINTGVPESDALDAEPDFKGMNLVGYDAMAVGNHEFDNSLSVIRQQQAWSNFPFLAANIYNEKNERLFEPYRIFSFGESEETALKVAVIGLTTHKTAEIGNPTHIKGLQFTLPEAETLALMPELEAQSDMVIAVTHMGHHAYSRGSDITLAKAINGLDLIIGGHSAEPVCMDTHNKLILDYKPGMACKPDFHNNTWVAQAYEWGKYVGRADFIIKKGKIKLKSYALIPVNLTLKDENGERKIVGETISHNQEMIALLQPFQEKGAAALMEVVGEASDTFWVNEGSRQNYPSPLGHLLSQAILESAKADVAIIQDGGIRDNLNKGTITVKDLLKIMPFGNTLVTQPFTGKALQTYFESIQLLPNNLGQIHYSGMTLLDDSSAERLSRQYPHGTINPNVLIGGQPLQWNKTYRLATNSYLAGGGNGFPVLINRPGYDDTGTPFVDDVKTFLQRIKTAAPSCFKIPALEYAQSPTIECNEFFTKQMPSSP